MHIYVCIKINLSPMLVNKEVKLVKVEGLIVGYKNSGSSMGLAHTLEPIVDKYYDVVRTRPRTMIK